MWKEEGYSTSGEGTNLPTRRSRVHVYPASSQHVAEDSCRAHPIFREGAIIIIAQRCSGQEALPSTRPHTHPPRQSRPLQGKVLFQAGVLAGKRV